MGSLGKLTNMESMGEPNSFSMISRASTVEKGGT